MEDTFYVGALALSFKNGIISNLEPFDQKFYEPVLPVSSRVTVRLKEVDRLDIPDGDSQMLGTRKVWHKGDREIRLYTACRDEPYLMSVLEGNEIVVYAKKNEWHKYQNEFRPWFNIHLEQLLLRNKAIVLHSASIIVKGKAIIFTAPSGTGKTTQTDLWHKYRQDVEDLNGDRTLIQWTESGWYACGFPIYGSSVRCEQRAVPIHAIVVIRRGNTDRIRELSLLEKVSLLYSEVTVPSIDSGAVNVAMNMIDQIIQSVNIIQMECTMEKSAVDVLQDYLNL